MAATPRWAGRGNADYAPRPMDFVAHRIRGRRQPSSAAQPLKQPPPAPTPGQPSHLRRQPQKPESRVTTRHSLLLRSRAGRSGYQNRRMRRVIAQSDSLLPSRGCERVDACRPRSPFGRKAVVSSSDFCCSPGRRSGVPRLRLTPRYQVPVAIHPDRDAGVADIGGQPLCVHPCGDRQRNESVATLVQPMGCIPAAFQRLLTFIVRVVESQSLCSYPPAHGARAARRSSASAPRDRSSAHSRSVPCGSRPRSLARSPPHGHPNPASRGLPQHRSRRLLSAAPTAPRA